MEPFKNAYNPTMIQQMGDHFKQNWSDFDVQGFVEKACLNLDHLELKERSDQITQSMMAYFPADFKRAADLLISSLGKDLSAGISEGGITGHGIAGWAILPMSHFVSLVGQDHFDLSMKALREMTKRFSSEFAIRFFIIKDQDQTLSVLHDWVNDPNEHVRRLVSEGTRPRLPWAMQLPALIQDPSPSIELLEKLKDDPSEYVRRSVANHLNDIAKDHPVLVIDLARKWMKDVTPERKRLIRHALRTLFKQGNTDALALFGYESPQISVVDLKVLTPVVAMGECVVFNVSFKSTSRKPQKLMIDYAIHFVKANGKRVPKVFKWKNVTVEAEMLLFAEKKHSFKAITTRNYYPGVHEVEILINGVSLGVGEFDLNE